MTQAGHYARPFTDRLAKLPVAVVVLEDVHTTQQRIAFHRAWIQHVAGTVLDETKLILIDGAKEFHYIDGTEVETARSRQDYAGLDPQPER